MQKAEALLRTVLPDVNLDDPNLDVNAPEYRLPLHLKDKQAAAGGVAAKPHGTSMETGPEAGDESLLETMVGNTGCLDRDDQGHWDYHGHTSGIIFVRRLRKQLGAVEPPAPRNVTAMLESPRSVSVSDSPQDASLPPTHDLPPRAVAVRLCHNALDDACSLMRFVIEPKFFASLDRIYETPPSNSAMRRTRFCLYCTLLWRSGVCSRMTVPELWIWLVTRVRLVKGRSTLNAFSPDVGTGMLTVLLQVPILQSRTAVAGNYGLSRSHLSSGNLFHGAFPPVIC